MARPILSRVLSDGVGGPEDCARAVEDAELTTVSGTVVAGCLAMSRYQKPSSNDEDVCPDNSESPYPNVFIAAMPQSQAAMRSGKRSWLGAMSIEPSSRRPPAEQHVEWTSITSNGDGGRLPTGRDTVSALRWSCLIFGDANSRRGRPSIGFGYSLRWRYPQDRDENEGHHATHDNQRPLEQQNRPVPRFNQGRLA
jgi:hypothetical protein